MEIEFCCRTGEFAAIIDFFSATLGLLSGVFFSMGVLALKGSTLNLIAFGMWDKGRVIAIELAQQKAQFMAGAVLLITSFLAQMLVKFFPSAPSSSGLEPKLIEAGVGVGVAIAFGLLAYLGYRHYQAKLVNALLEEADREA